MRQFAIAVILTAVLLFFPGCNRFSKQTDNSQSSGSVPQSYNQTEFTPRGFTAIQYAPIYDLSSGRPEWIGAPDFGEVLEFDLSEVNSITKEGKPVVYKPQGAVTDGGNVFLIPVLWEGQRCWIDVSYYAPENSQVAVVIVPFEAQGLEDGEGTFRRGDLIVFDPSRNNNILYAPVFGAQVNEAVSKKQISFDSVDVETAKLLVKARSARNSEQARELLQEASEKYPSSALFSLITEMLNPQANRTESLVTLFSTAVEQTAVYTVPDFSSAITTQLEQYIDVKTSERTTTPELTRAGSAHWYHISEPADGWVFGLSLEGAD
jgi:hypothetical protein